MSAWRFVTLALCLVALVAPVSWAADLPPDLALVPADAAGFIHVRLGDAVRSEHLKEFRELPHVSDAFHLRQSHPRTVDRFLPHRPARACRKFRTEFLVGKPSGISTCAVTGLVEHSSIAQTNSYTGLRHRGFFVKRRVDAHRHTRQQ